MNKKENDAIDLRGTPAFERMRSFLASYRKCKRVCESYSEEKKLGLIKPEEIDVRDSFYRECLKRCHSVEVFISTVNCPQDERRMLWLHYVEGMSIEAVSERLYVSRSTAFRISRRAETAALYAFVSLESKQSQPERSVS